MKTKEKASFLKTTIIIFNLGNLIYVKKILEVMKNNLFKPRVFMHGKRYNFNGFVDYVRQVREIC